MSILETGLATLRVSIEFGFEGHEPCVRVLNAATGKALIAVVCPADRVRMWAEEATKGQLAGLNAMIDSQRVAMDALRAQIPIVEPSDDDD